MGPSTLAETMGPLLQPPVICQVGAIPLLYPILEELGLQTEVKALLGTISAKELANHELS